MRSGNEGQDRFLVTDTAKTFDFQYLFNYTAFAGDLLIPPYPLNIVIGNTAMADARGKSIQNANGINQRTLWRDVNKNAWIVSGNGKFFHQYFYPFRGDFYLPSTTPIGTPVAWVPDTGTNFTGVGASLNPVKVVYDTFWRSDYPKLKRGETLTYQGGEYFSETPGSNGLPALVAMKAAELIYDSAIPSMVISSTGTNSYDLNDASARIIRPLDRREKPFTVANMGLSGFTPAANTKIFIVAERWYFKELPGSLQKRFYFDSLAEKLVFRGYLNDKDSGNKDLTVPQGLRREGQSPQERTRTQCREGRQEGRHHYSEHQASRFKGGIVGWLESQGGMDSWTKAVAEIAFSLTKPGEVSEVKVRPEGIFLVRYMALKPAMLRSFESVASELERTERSRLKQQAETDYFKEMAAKYPVQQLIPGTTSKPEAEPSQAK